MRLRPGLKGNGAKNRREEEERGVKRNHPPRIIVIKKSLPLVIPDPIEREDEGGLPAWMLMPEGGDSDIIERAKMEGGIGEEDREMIGALLSTSAMAFTSTAAEFTMMYSSSESVAGVLAVA